MQRGSNSGWHRISAKREEAVVNDTNQFLRPVSTPRSKSASTPRCVRATHRRIQTPSQQEAPTLKSQFHRCDPKKNRHSCTLTFPYSYSWGSVASDSHDSPMPSGRCLATKPDFSLARHAWRCHCFPTCSLIALVLALLILLARLTPPESSYLG